MNFIKRWMLSNGVGAPESAGDALMYGGVSPAVASVVPAGKDSSYYEDEANKLKSQAVGSRGSIVPELLINMFSGLAQAEGIPIKGISHNTDAVLARQYALEAAKADAEKGAKDAATATDAQLKIREARSILEEGEKFNPQWEDVYQRTRGMKASDPAIDAPMYPDGTMAPNREQAYSKAVSMLAPFSGNADVSKALTDMSSKYDARQMLHGLARMKKAVSVPVSDALYDAEALADPSIYKTAAATEDRFANQMQYGQQQNSFQMAEAEKRAAERRAAADRAAALKAEEDAKPKLKPSETGMKVLPMDGINKIANMNRASKSLETLKDRLANLAQWKRNPGIGQALGFTRPFDQEVALIRQSAVSLIPTIARGVYGEVGVLTDNDVKRYSAVLPGLGDKPEVADAMIAGLFADAESARSEALNAYKLAGYDVSGFERLEEDTNPEPAEKKKPDESSSPSATLDRLKVLAKSGNATARAALKAKGIQW